MGPTIIFTGGPMGDNSDQSNTSSNPKNRRQSLMKDQSRSKRLSFSQQNQTHDIPAARRPQLQLDDPLDGPWQRAKDEWKDPDSWFGIDDCGRLLDVPRSFGGRQTVQKWLIWAWMIVTLLYLWSTAGSAWFLGNLDHWALAISMVYQTLSLANGHFAPPQPASSVGLNLYLKWFWIIFEIAAHLQLLATLLFWVIVFPTNDLPINYGTFALHGLGLMAVWIDGMSLNRIPVRIKHYFVVLVVDTIYCLWTIIHAAAGLDNGNYTSSGNKNPDESDAIYLALDWRNETVQSVFLMIAILALFAPLCFLAQYCLSLYSFPWTWNGSKSRVVIDFDMSRSAYSRSHRRPPLDTPQSPTAKKSTRSLPSAGGNTSETSRTSSRLLDADIGSSDKRGGRRSSLRGTSPSPAGRRASTPVRATSPPPSKRASVRASTPVRARATSPRPTPQGRRASTAARSKSPAPRRASAAARPKSPAPGRSASPVKKSKKATPQKGRRASTAKKANSSKTKSKKAEVPLDIA